MAKTAKKKSGKKKTGGDRLQFQAEVGRLLDIVANSLYSEKEIFLRELISNASDACDRLRHAALTAPDLAAGDPDYKIAITIDRAANTLAVADNGIGMNRDDLVDDLGTIARSGTAAFMGALKETEAKSEDGTADVNLIGQFGVGFYSAFMVADEVTVTTRKAGETSGWRWVSDGKGEFTVEAADGATRGTTVTMVLKDNAGEYLEPARIRHIVKTYSDHVSFPILLTVLATGDEDEGKDETEDESGTGEAVTDEIVNQASAIWARPKADIDEQTHKEFYHHVAHAMDDPWLTLHFKAEGMIEYTGLLYVPTARPFDIFHPERKSHVKLYVKRVFITDDCEALLPSWLRFLHGVVDSEDLPLNVSRELLQNNPVLTRIRAGVTSRVLNELTARAEKDPEGYAAFWEAFGAVVKEGLYEDFEHREKLLGLARFNGTADDELVGLADYVGRMKEGQEAIYYITADDLAQARRSPQLEGFRAKGIEVLLLADPIDEFWLPSVGVYETKPFKSVTRGGADLADIKSEDAAEADEKKEEPKPTEGLDALVALIKLELGEAVKDVRRSDRLTDSAVCLVADEGDIDMNLQRLLQQHNQLENALPRILEINPTHELVRRLAAGAAKDGAQDRLRDVGYLLLDQARILEGETVPDPVAYAKRMTSVMTAAFAED